MHLSKEQLDTYERDGFLVVPKLFSEHEIQAMKADLERIQKIDTDHLVRERSGGVAKTIYRVHEADGPTASPVFHAAARSPRLLHPAQKLLGDDALYVYHTKCNLKTAIDGSVWQWHQDYGTWKKDGVPEPMLTTALIMLDEPTQFNGWV
jgi:ectoine hydroxylase